MPDTLCAFPLPPYDSCCVWPSSDAQLSLKNCRTILLTTTALGHRTNAEPAPEGHQNHQHRLPGQPLCRGYQQSSKLLPHHRQEQNHIGGRCSLSAMERSNIPINLSIIRAYYGRNFCLAISSHSVHPMSRHPQTQPPVKPCAQTTAHGIPDEIYIRDYTHANDLTVAMCGLRNDISRGNRRRSPLDARTAPLPDNGGTGFRP